MERLPKDNHEIAAGSGVVGTRWNIGALMGGGLGALVGLAVGLVWSAAASDGNGLWAVAICVFAFAVAGAVVVFMLGGMHGAAEYCKPPEREGATRNTLDAEPGNKTDPSGRLLGGQRLP